MTIDLSRALPYLTPVASADETAPIQAFGSLDAPVSRAFSMTLNVTYMIDEPGALLFVRQRDVETHQREHLHARATENLRAYAARRRLRFEARGRAHVARLDGQHDASLLLLDELWDAPTRVADPEGELIAIVPERGTLIFAGSTAQGAVADLRGTLAQASYRALSPEIFVRRNRAWEPFD